MSFGEKLKNARLLAGLKQEELASEISVSKMTVSKYENDKMQPGKDKLREICRVLNRDYNYFQDDNLYTLQTEPVFRLKGKVKSLKDNEVSKIKAQTNETLSPYIDVLRLLGKDSVKLCDSSLRRAVSSKKDIEKAAQDVRDAWGLGRAPIANLIDTVEKHGFIIIPVDAKTTHVEPPFDATFYPDEECGPVIVLSFWPKLTKNRQRFTLAHELGHYFITNSGANAKKICGEEALANYFAAALLMPESDVLQYENKCRTFILDEIYALSDRYGMSVESVVYRLHTLNLISDMNREELLAGYKYAHYHSKENPVWEASIKANWILEEPLQMKRDVYQAIGEGLISRNRGEEILRSSIPLSDANKGVVLFDV